MLQLPVSKQGRFQVARWNDRVATFDRQHLCVFLSKKNDVGQPYYHKLHVKTVRLWPHYSTGDVHDWRATRHSILTIAVTGVELPVTPEDKVRVLESTYESRGAGDATVGFSVPLSAAGKEPCETSAAAAFCDVSGGADAGRHGESAATATPPTAEELKRGKKTEWFLRCCTVEDLSNLLAAFESLGSALAGAHRNHEATYEESPNEISGPRIVGDMEQVSVAFTKVADAKRLRGIDI